MNKDYNITMNGTIDETTAIVNWYFVDLDSKWTVVGTFNGTWWDGGAKLDLSSTGSAPATSGEAERVECEHCEDDDSFVEKHEKKIIAGSVVVGVAIIAAIGVGAWFALGWWKKRQYQPTNQVDDHDAWALEEHHHERELKGGTSAGISAVDTSYDSHRRYSASDPALAAGFEYKDSYTPLK
jgi:hypothetical protein